MITILFKDCNTFSQNFYDQTIDTLQLHRVQCTCGKKGCLIFHGHYRRNVKWLSDLIELVIQRVWCKDCGISHALIPSFLVPYSQIPLADQQEILDRVQSGKSMDAVMERNLLIDENNIKYIIRQFKKHWEQRLLSIGRSVRDSLTIPCLAVYSRQFMQIRRTPNLLFSSTNMA